MPGIGKVGADNAGGGIITGPGAPTVFAEGSVVSCAGGLLPGDTVFTHGEPPHTGGATIVNGSATVFAEGRPVTVAILSVASCGHPIGPGAVTVQVGI
jgi:uncharacterized Zn-binding protein involved in type VI secretion